MYTGLWAGPICPLLAAGRRPAEPCAAFAGTVGRFSGGWNSRRNIRLPALFAPMEPSPVPPKLAPKPFSFAFQPFSFAFRRSDSQQKYNHSRFDVIGHNESGQ
jgi:hypothetical protein